MIIADTEELSRKMGLGSNYLLLLLRHRDRLYRGYYLTKSDGRLREIEAPNRELKALQRWILRNLLDGMEVSDRAKGFTLGRSAIDHAALHVNRRAVLMLDIRDFFPSIGTGAVRTVLERCSGSEEVCDSLTLLCTYRDHLPQGAPSSPRLSNLVFKPVDEEVAAHCDSLDIAYSRYADDMAFSSDDYDELEAVKAFVEESIGQLGLRLNEDKTRMLTQKRAMIVGGLRLNAGHPTIGREQKRRTRAALHHWLAKGSAKESPNSILGRLAYIRGIEPDYYAKLQEYARGLQS